MKFLALCCLAFVLVVHQSMAVAPPFGQLAVDKTKLVGEDGKPVQLIGMSLYWSQWQPQFWNKETVDALKCPWNTNVVRAAMAVEEGGYLTNKAAELQKVYDVADAAIAAGIYVIVDWHDHHANQHEADAIDFFKQVSAKYGSEPNILYETWNEPLQEDWSSVLKPYHIKVIEVIRANDPKNVIIVGTPAWDQEVEKAAADPITGQINIAYTLHFYAGTHKQDLRDKAKSAIEGVNGKEGICLFVTEYGTVNADGNGAPDAGETQKWWDFLDENKISYVNWAVEDKAEGAAAFVPGTTSAQVGDDSKLTESGKLVKAWYQKKKEETGVKC